MAVQLSRWRKALRRRGKRKRVDLTEREVRGWYARWQSGIDPLPRIEKKSGVSRRRLIKYWQAAGYNVFDEINPPEWRAPIQISERMNVRTGLRRVRTARRRWKRRWKQQTRQHQ